MKKDLIHITQKSDNKNYMDKQKKDIWTSLTPDQKAEIKKGIAQLDDGKRSSIEVVLKNIS